MKNQLPPLVDSVIIHYGCTKFENKEHKVHWIGAISHDPGKKYFFKHNDEVKMIEELRDYMLKNKDKTFIHWSMNKPNFGFMALERRYLELAKKEIKLSPALAIDLSEYLKIKYGINYIDRENGRLNNLAKLNSFSGFQVEVEVKDLNQASDRLELIFSITQAEGQESLIINTSEKDYKKFAWFKIGVKFASGEMDILYKEHECSATKVAAAINLSKSRNYITQSMGTDMKSDKNIYACRKKMIKIIKHCKDQDIPIIPEFTSRLPLE